MRRWWSRGERRFNWEPDFSTLATYNGERARGLVHTPEYQERMAVIQRRFNDETARAFGSDILVPLEHPDGGRRAD